MRANLSTEQPATRAYFNNYMNIRGKTIVGASNESPSHLINRRTYPDWEERLPDVKYFSDALWIEWATVARSQRTPLAANDLKYIFMRDILSNEYTRWVMEQCAGVGQDDFDEDWPGLQFDMGTPQFKALLGTNHGITVVNLLIQHPNELHDKTVESITIFTASYHTDYDILFTLTGAGN